MSREIKFRAWDKEQKEWIDMSTLRFAIDGRTRIADMPPSRYDLLQFTGLKDKNGKEIYESDLVKSQFEHPVGAEWGVEGEVVWENGRYHVKGYNIYNLSDLEVTGNKYEG